jgi:hypothetical protein
MVTTISANASRLYWFGYWPSAYNGRVNITKIATISSPFIKPLGFTTARATLMPGAEFPERRFPSYGKTSQREGVTRYHGKPCDRTKYVVEFN